MPLNVLRLNQKSQHPTERIVFIKSLPGDDAPLATEFLNRVAAICHPILKNNWLSVTTLEEYEPNREFIGRNFNNGECIQLVLKQHSGAWRSFRSVVMVMMHELAHNVHMNHSRNFWKVRNQFAEEMRGLWQKGYTGEGIWGPGREIETGFVIGGGREPESDMPEHLCGGAYRSRRKKRVRGPELTWKEKKEKRITKKFGVNGQSLGEDVVERNSLQGFKGPTVKSRVAKSKRGRELRAAAALARLENAKTEPVKEELEDENEDVDAESGDEYEDADAGLEDAKDIDGSQLKDPKGRSMIRVCEDEDADDVEVKREMEELNDLDDIPSYKPSDRTPGSPEKTRITIQIAPQSLVEQDPASSDLHEEPKATARSINQLLEPDHELIVKTEPRQTETASDVLLPQDKPIDGHTASGELVSDRVCDVCSMSNDSTALLCAMCSNVMDPSKCPGAWKCGSTACVESKYLNCSDYGVCGVCGARRGS